LELWALTVSAAVEPCLVIDAGGLVVAASPGYGELFSVPDVAILPGHHLADVLELRDFNRSSGRLPAGEIDKIPPLLAITSRGLARGLLRVLSASKTSLVDAISVPLGGPDAVSGSLTFFSKVKS
jgi:PAS domain-containing protein